MLTKPKIRTRFDRKQVATVNNEPSLTEQSHADQCNINMIVKRAQRTGMFPQPSQPAQYLDCPSIDYHAAVETVAKAEQSFMELPAKVRRHYNNDPAQFLNATQKALQTGEIDQILVDNQIMSPKDIGIDDKGQNTGSQDDKPKTGGKKGSSPKNTQEDSGEPQGDSGETNG